MKHETIRSFSRLICVGVLCAAGLLTNLSAQEGGLRNIEKKRKPVVEAIPVEALPQGRKGERATGTSVLQPIQIKRATTLQTHFTGAPEPAHTQATSVNWVNIVSQNFESSFPGTGWQIFYNTAAPYFWDDVPANAHGGSRSGWCAGATLPPNPTPNPNSSPYVNNMNSWLVYGPFDLSDATDAKLDFWHWLDTEQDFDYLYWTASIDNISYYGNGLSGNSNGYVFQSFDLKAVPTLGDITGESSVYIAFIFQSDASVTGRGAFLDDVVLQKFVGAGGQADLVADQVLLRTAPNNGGTVVTAPVAGQQYYPHFEFHNAGGVAANNFALDIRLNNTLLCSGTTNIAANGTGGVYCNTPVTWPTGSNTLQGNLDLNNTIAESNENNNSASRTYTPTPGTPDINVTPTSLTINQTVNSNAGSRLNIAPPVIDFSQLHLPGQFIVKFKPEMQVPETNQAVAMKTGDASTDAVLQQLQISKIEHVYRGPRLIDDLKNTVVLHYSVALNPEAVAEALRSLPNVEWVDLNYLHRMDDIPNDPSYNLQYYLTKIEAASAWDLGVGNSGINIAIIDSGVDWDHPDLAANIWSNTGEVPNNNVDDDNNGFTDDTRGWDWVTGNPGSGQSACNAANGEDCNTEDNNPMDFNGHGTHVGGIASAVTDNGVGIAGIARGCKVMALRAGWHGIDGNGYLSTSFINAATQYAVDNGADVINMSFTGSSSILPMVNYAYNNGVVVVHAAGNSNISTPSAIDNINQTISVAATNQNDVKASFSNYGSWIDVSAPGVGIYSTVFNNSYASFNGTSMSAPLVAGLAGLLLAQDGSLTVDQVTTVIKTTTDNIDAENPGFVGMLGTGRINALKAMQEVVGGPPTANTFTIQNLGTDVLTVNNIAANANWLSASGYPNLPFTVAAGGSQTVTVNVDWNLVGGAMQTSSIAVSSNDPDEASVSVSVTAVPSQTPPITVNAPAAGATWTVGSTQTVSWSSSNVTGNVNIKLSTDGGSTFPITLASNTADDGTQSVTVPNNPSTTARVRVESVANSSIFGNNPGNFTIQSQPQQSINVTSPAAGATWLIGATQAVSWSSSNVTGNVNIKLSTDGGSTFPITLASNTADDGTQNVTVPDNPSTTARVRVESVANSSVFGNNPGNFTITEISTCDPTACNGPAIFPVAQGVTVLGETITARDGETICIDIRLKENAQPIDAFGFMLQVDPDQLTFVSVEKGDLTNGFITVSAQENPAGSGTFTCGGFGITAIPANSAGVLMRLCFTVNCNTLEGSDIVLSAPTDDLAGFATCCNRFECVTCLHDGDVNGDLTLTPGDALCAFQIYLNNGSVPATCDAANFECELTASDVNCDNTTTPGDALAIFSRYLQNLPPLDCFARTNTVSASVQPYQLALETRTLVAGAEQKELVKVVLRVANPQNLQSLGLQLQYPADKLELLGVTRAALTAEWMQLEGRQLESGVVRVGGFHSKPIVASHAGELLEIVFASNGQTVTRSEFVLSDFVDDFKNVHVEDAATSVSANESTPTVFKLYQSYPNPFKSGAFGNEMIIRFDLPGATVQPVELSIYNVAGQLVRRLVSGVRTPGAYEVRWDGRNEHDQAVPSGTYLYRLKAGKLTESKQLTIVR